MGTEGSPDDTEGAIAELRRELEDLRAVTGTEALDIRSQLRTVERRLGDIEQADTAGAEEEDAGIAERRRRIKEAKAKLTPEEIANIRQERLVARSGDDGSAQNAGTAEQ
jgi:hypothetical protein